MKVLLTVFSLLMVLMLLTVTQMNSYMVHQILGLNARQTLLAYEFQWSERMARRAYDSTRKPSSRRGGKEEQEVEQEEQEKLYRHFNFTVFLGALQKEDESALLQKRLFSRLIQSLGEGEAFYQQFLREQDALGRSEDQVLGLLLESILGYFVERKPKHRDELTKVLFDDEAYRNVFAKFLGGQDGLYYPDIRRYLSMQKRDKQQISVYLADVALLKAILGSDEAVTQVRELRREIYRDLIQGHTTTKEGAERLRAITPETVFDRLLSFGVSKTRPPSTQ